MKPTSPVCSAPPGMARSLSSGGPSSPGTTCGPGGDELADLAGRQLAAVLADHAHDGAVDRDADRQRARGGVDRRARVPIGTQCEGEVVSVSP